jgi:hypothetical protein
MYKPGDTLKGLGRHGGEGQRYEVGKDWVLLGPVHLLGPGNGAAGQQALTSAKELDLWWSYPCYSFIEIVTRLLLWRPIAGAHRAQLDEQHEPAGASAAAVGQ